MRKLLTIFLTLILGTSTAFGYEMVLPKDKKSISNTDYAFFVGKANNGETISINDENVYVAPNGAFAHSVKLKEGENRIAVRTNYNTRIYKILRNKTKSDFEPKLTEFDPSIYAVIKDNTPLRSTPEDYGMNRMSHLFEGTKLVINGEKNGFYRVYLSKNKTGWIDKDSVVECALEKEAPQFITMNSESFKNASIHKIEFTEKLPYTIDETKDEIIFKVYNPLISDNSVYTINIKKPDKYTYKTILSNGTYVLKVNEVTNVERALDGVNIFIDPGHGGSEFGAIGCLGDKEKDINLKIGLELKDILTLMGANVYLSRECDGSVSLSDRVKMAKDNLANIFVSIHLNSIPDIKMDIHKNRGTSVYYYNPNSKNLAECVLNSVTNSVKTRNDKVRTGSYAVIRPTEYIGILVETAYMTNPLDSMIYRSEDFPRAAAKGIADGIFNYLHSCK